MQPQDVDRFFKTCCNPVKAIVESFCFYDCDLCDAEYVGYKSRHLHQRIDEHPSLGNREAFIERPRRAATFLYSRGVMEN